MAAPCQAQTPELASVLRQAQIAYNVGLAAIAEGMVRAYPEIFRNSPGVMRIIHRTAGEIGAKIIEQVTTNHLVREQVARHVYREAAVSGLRGEALLNHLGRGTSWKRLASRRMGSADIRVMMVVVVAAVAGLTGHAVGEELLRIEKSHATSAEAEAYNDLIGLLLSRIRAGTVKLCGSLTFAGAAARLKRNMSERPGTPFRGIACKRNGQDAGDGESGEAIVVTSASYGLNRCRSYVPPAGKTNWVSAGNVTAHVASACNGKSRCTYKIDYRLIGDPAFGCQKDYQIEWRCGPGGRTKGPRIVCRSGCEAGYGQVITLTCP